MKWETVLLNITISSEEAAQKQKVIVYHELAIYHKMFFNFQSMLSSYPLKTRLFLQFKMAQELIEAVMQTMHSLSAAKGKAQNL